MSQDRFSLIVSGSKKNTLWTYVCIPKIAFRTPRVSENVLHHLHCSTVLKSIGFVQMVQKNQDILLLVQFSVDLDVMHACSLLIVPALVLVDDPLDDIL